MHSLLFLLGGVLFHRNLEYGLEMSSGGMDIELVAAPLSSEAPVASAEVQKTIQVQKEEEEIVVPEELLQPVLAQEKPQSISNAKSERKGDGSSKVAGQDQTTLSSVGGGATSEKPGYLKNPPPPYPAEAIRKGQEGLVLISVWVNRHGKVDRAEIAQSSGFESLDRSAIKTVKKWIFSPARMGALAVESQVQIPVRFKLDDLKPSRRS